MPIFEYKCECGEKLEVIQAKEEPPKCKCGKLMKRIMSVFGFKI